jgi:hypothetical protein
LFPGIIIAVKILDRHMPGTAPCIHLIGSSILPYENRIVNITHFIAEGLEIQRIGNLAKFTVNK